MILYMIIIVAIIAILIILFLQNKYEGMDNISTTTIPPHAKDTEPYINPVIVPNLLNDTQINDILDHASHKIADQDIIEGRFVYARNKQHLFIRKENEIIKPILEHIAKIVNMPYENAENVLVARYMPYQTYMEHMDSCCDDNDKCRDFIKRGGERVLSLIVYLSDGFKGGGTFFNKLGLNIRPDKGGAILFHPLAQTSRKCHPNSLHTEQPLDGGIKWLMHVWFRETAFL